MPEGKAGPKSPGTPEGWASDSSAEDYRNFSTSGRGATTADDGKPEEGPQAVAGGPQPEFPGEGWGEPDENYPPTQGPLGDEYGSRDRPPRRRD
jgi:hypothetical protein